MSLGSIGSKGCARLGGSDSSLRCRAMVVRGGKLENRTYSKERHKGSKRRCVRRKNEGREAAHLDEFLRVERAVEVLTLTERLRQ